MKNVKFLMMLMFVSLLIGNGCRKDESFKEDIVALTQNRSTFSDTTAWEHMYIYNFLKSMDTSELVSFLNTFGSPLWEFSFQKRSEKIKITTVPILLNDSINGVIRLYITDQNEIKVDFFSKLEINAAILRQDLNNEEFQLFKGAVQSFITTEYLYCGHVNNNYLNWLIENKDRPESRVAWYCIEEWECVTTVTQRPKRHVYLYQVNTWNYLNQNLADSKTECFLLSRDCYVDYTPRNFPSTIYSGGSGGSNGNTGGGTTGSNGGGGSGSSNDNAAIRNAKIQFLTEFFNFTGISPIHQDILYACIGVLTIPNYSPSGIIDVTSDMKCIRGQLGAEISKVLGLSAAEIEKLSIEDLYKKTKVADCLRKTGNAQDAEKDKLIDFYKNTDLIDPCTGDEIDKDDIILSLCQNNKVNIEGLEEALEGLDIIKEDISFNKVTCPILYCLYNKMLKMSNNFVCTYVTPTFDSDKFILNIKVNQAGAGSSAHVTYDPMNKEATLTFDPILCNSTDQVGTMAKILHEFVHVELARKMHLKGYNIADINDYYKFYPKLSNYIYDIALEQGMNEIHHNIMIEYEKIIDKMALTLFNMFNGSTHGLTIDHFKLSAATGLFNAMSFHQSPDPQFTTLLAYFQDKYGEKSNILKSKNLNLGC
ncbi:MAG: hypothetical protein IPN79_13700 [Saprospiraceae bacterium]|nr:hypothetical protein [Saprospiraceae bacterium]